MTWPEAIRDIGVAVAVAAAAWAYFKYVLGS
jgi:hypothetical protein